MSKPLPTCLRLVAGLALALLVSLPSCATIVGTATGAITGAVDAPRTIYRLDKEGVDNAPELWLPIVVVFAPLGIVLGPVMGMAKGLAIDIQAGIQDMYTYGEAFGTYGTRSVWRPYTFSEGPRGRAF